MRYYAQYNDSDKLIAIGTGVGRTKITKAEYNALVAEIREKAVHCGRGRNSTARDQRRRTFRH